MEDIQQLYKNQLTQVNQLYQNRLEDIITTMKNAALQSDSLPAAQQAEAIKQALFNERESAIQRFMSENASLKAEFYKEQQDRTRFQQLYTEREKKYQKLKKAFNDQKNTLEKHQSAPVPHNIEKYKEKYLQIKQENDELRNKLSSQKSYAFGQQYSELELQNQIKSAAEKLSSEHNLKVQQLQNESQMRLNQALFEGDQKIQKYKISAEKKISLLQTELLNIKQTSSQHKQLVSDDLKTTEFLEQNNAKLAHLLDQERNEKANLISNLKELETLNSTLTKKHEVSASKTASLTHKYATMQNELSRIKDALESISAFCSQKFVLSTSETASLLAKLFKFLDYNSLKNQVSANLENYVKTRENELRKQFLDVISDVQGAVGELK
ncbi:hypothetical protein SS50377_25344 [Spironucleus salmonicida]|uniref:Uncharacterized protein n=1 Tax=Spironucleus salmonicida TaxID=348837 RepID=V6LM45_9EUKA|nr:hypothetical protein SS50377_25344 [Spironucleus salmonicida]|eukprot:EST41779.1 Hypothetical protein SS50377_18612 [Spironucleus salmonicida]